MTEALKRTALIAVLVAAALTAYSPSRAAPSASCTPVASAREIAVIEDLNHKHPWAEYEKILAVDCIVVTARQYAKTADASSVLARAVAAGCAPQIDAVSRAVFEQSMIFNKGLPEQADLALTQSKEIEAVLRDLTLKYVIEARAKHCPVERPEGYLPLPPEEYDPG